jgi:hypothetical protein
MLFGTRLRQRPVRVSSATLRTSENDGHEHFVIDHQKRIAEPEMSHNELRAALIVASREVKRLNFAERDTQIFRMLRTKSPEA